MKITKSGITNSIIIIVIFSITGATTVYVSSLIMDGFGLEKWSFLYWVIYLFLILPVYHLLLFGYALLFGKFDFFFGRAKTFIRKITSWFS